MKQTTRIALLLALAAMLLVFHVNTTPAKLMLQGGPTAVEAAHGSQSATSPRITLSDVDNTRGYVLGVTGIGFTGVTTASVYVLHDPSVALGALDDGANEAALCQRIINEGTLFGFAIVDSDGQVVVVGMVTVPTFNPGSHNYICMVDGTGRTSGTDVERFHLEHSIRVVPSVATAGDSVTIFSQDFPNAGAGLTALRVGGRPVTASSSSVVSAGGSATATFTIPSYLAGVVSVEAAWGNVSGATNMTVVSGTENLPLTSPTDVVATSSGETITVLWTPGSGAASQVMVVVNVVDDTDYCLGFDVTGSGSSYECAGVTAGATYVVLVIALDGQGGYAIGQDSQGSLVTHTVPAMMADAAVLAVERGALVALYNATGGADWTDRTNWLSNRPLEEWHGVVTDDSGHVAVLNLTANRLTGRVPTQLGNLSNLEVLSLGDNQLTGPIPSNLGNLSNLTKLWLYGNQLTGPVPTQLGNLSNLEVLSLGDNQLTGPIPSNLGSLTSLENLQLWGNQLTGSVPTWLGNLSNLESLGLSRNQLTGPIPSNLGNLSNLTKLWLYGNQLTGPVPTQLGNLSNLEVLSLGDNQLTGPIPSNLGSLTSLENLQLWGNQLTGSVPTWLGNLSNLEVLSLGDNQLTGPIPSNLGNLSNLTKLWLYGNQLTGPVPTQLGNLSNLEVLSLGDNQLTGPVPTSTGQPIQSGGVEPWRQPVDRADPVQPRQLDQFGKSTALGQSVDWLRTNLAGQPLQSGEPGPWRQPVDRADPVQPRQPLQLDEAMAVWEPVDGSCPNSTGQPIQSGGVEPQQKPVDRADPVQPRQLDQFGKSTALGQSVDWLRTNLAGQPIQSGGVEPQQKPVDRVNTIAAGRPRQLDRAVPEP